MSFFTVIAYSLLMVVLGYMIGNNTGKQEGYLDGRSDVFKEMR